MTHDLSKPFCFLRLGPGKVLSISNLRIRIVCKHSYLGITNESNGILVDCFFIRYVIRKIIK